jgi:hypothetical protein
MALWRCPHCGTPQPVAARCWVCRRSSTSCGTCKNFRASVAARIGYCGLDRERRPLAGDEIRGCWVGFAAIEDAAGSLPVEAVAEVAVRGAMRGFVPVEALLVHAPPEQEPEPDPEPLNDRPAVPETILAVTPPPPDGLLWADLEG